MHPNVRKTATHVSSTFFFFNDTATTEIYTLSLHDALPISRSCWATSPKIPWRSCSAIGSRRYLPRSSSSPAAASRPRSRDRKSTRLNSSHSQISYAVFCLKKNNGQSRTDRRDAESSLPSLV